MRINQTHQLNFQARFKIDKGNLSKAIINSTLGVGAGATALNSGITATHSILKISELDEISGSSLPPMNERAEHLFNTSIDNSNETASNFFSYVPPMYCSTGSMIIGALGSSCIDNASNELGNPSRGPLRKLEETLESSLNTNLFDVPSDTNETNRKNPS